MQRLLTLAFLLVVFDSSLFSQGAEYLIITHDDLEQYVQPLADWKNRKGIKTQMVTLSETGTTEPEIKGYIQNAYDSWTIKPRYVLLVGNIGPFPLPARYVKYEQYLEFVRYSDTPYGDVGNIGEESYFAEIAIGRFPVGESAGRTPSESEADCRIMVAKTIGYEKGTHVGDPAWIGKSTLAVRGGLGYDPYQYVADSRDWTDILQGVSPHNKTWEDLEPCINDGRAFVVYRGFGGATYWRARELIYFFSDGVEHLLNGWELPVFIGASCASGRFWNPDNHAWCNRCIRAGNDEDHPNGAVAFLGAGSSDGGRNLAWSRSYMCAAVFEVLLSPTSPKYILGDVFLEAKEIMHGLTVDVPLRLPKQEYVGWHLIGDPALEIWTDMPQELIVCHPPYTPVGVSSDFVVEVTEEDATPIQDACVCLWKGDEVYEVEYTDATGEYTFSIPATTTEGEMYVTVTKHDYIPYEGSAGIGRFLVTHDAATSANNQRKLAYDNDRLFLTFESDNRIFYTYRDNGGEWHPTEQMEKRGKYPALALDQGTPSKPAVCWVATEDEEVVLYYYHPDVTTSPHELYRMSIGAPGGGFHPPSMVVDNEDYAHVVLHTVRLGSRRPHTRFSTARLLSIAHL